MKRFTLLIAVMILVLPTFAVAQDEEEITVEEGLEEILNEVDVSEWDEWFLQQSEQMRQLWDNKLPSDFLNELVVEQNLGRDWDGVMAALYSALLSALPSALIMFAAYIGFAILGGVFKGLRPSGGITGASQLAFSALMGCFALAQVWTLIAQSQSTLNGIGSLMEIIQPVLIALLFLFGSQGSATVLQPMTVLLSGTIINIMVSVVLPLAVVGGVVGVMDALMGKERFSGMGRLCHRLCKWAVTACSTLYLIVTTIRGLVANASDSVLLKTGKFAASSLPFVGRLVSDSLDTAYGCMVLVKNGVGVTGIVLGLYWVAKPALLLLLNILVLRSAAALSAPISADSYQKVLTALADMLSVLLSALIAAMVMFIVTIGLLSGLGGSV